MSTGWPQRPLLRVLLVAVVPALIVYVLALLLSAAAGIRTQLVIRDLAQSCDTALGVGFLSNVGYLLWISAAAIALFGALSGVVDVRGRVRQLLLCGGGFSLLLCLDDMFLLHDRYIGSSFLYSLYAIFALLILFRFRAQVQALGGGSFLLAVVLLGLSVITDQLQELIPIDYATLQLFEEGAKFLGIAAWLAFWWQATAGAGKLKA
ncbi:oxidoreductase [Synechococcus sp. HK05]|uniref:oxidoreductase n=1 Tax=Synechococcus sp. HK05 TaxID=2725975 RepID=UPI001C3823D2|nr:oxidoreductase [Synechococcus sp. HK05]MBV2352498.1 oxidoreductase [Synechococcus sp. HK05]